MIFFKWHFCGKFWFGLFIWFKLVKVHYSEVASKGADVDSSWQPAKQISSAQLLISINIWDWSSQPDILTEFIQVSDYGDFFLHDFCNLPLSNFLSGQAGKCWLSANLPLICIKKRLNPCNAQVARSLF